MMGLSIKQRTIFNAKNLKQSFDNEETIGVITLISFGIC
jgi:hypothetical protein